MAFNGQFKLKKRLFARCLLTFSIAAVCIFSINSKCAADLIFKSSDKFKAQKTKKYDAPIINVSVPVQIVDLPVSWRGADLAVMAEVFFYKKGAAWQKGIKGCSFGRVIKTRPFTNGSSQGMVHVPLYKLKGVITGQYVTIAMVLAKLGNQCKLLGFGMNFPSVSGGLDPDVKENLNGLINGVGPWNDKLVPFL